MAELCEPAELDRLSADERKDRLVRWEDVARVLAK
jgi:hypothetical protein